MLSDLSNIWRWLRLLEYPNLTGLLPIFASLSLCMLPALSPPHHDQISPWGSLACAQNKSGWCVPHSGCLFLSLLPTNGGVWGAWSPLLPRWSPPWTKQSVLFCSLSYSCFLMAADLRSHDATSAWGSGQKELRFLFLTWYCTFSPVPWSSFAWGSTCLATGPPMALYQNVPLSSRYIPSL